MPRRKIVRPIFTELGLQVAFGLHVAAIIMIGLQQGWTTAKHIPFSIVEASVAFLVLVRFFFANVRDDILKKKSVSYKIKYCMFCLNFPGGTLSEAIYFLTFGCVVFRVLLFNEQSDCLLDTCTPSMQQKYISLVANVILWSVAEERKPVKVGKPAGKVNPTGKIKNTVKLLRPDQVVLDLSGTKNFGFRKRVTGKIRLV